MNLAGGKTLRAALAGGLVFAGVAVGTTAWEIEPASAAAVDHTVSVGDAPESITSDGAHLWVTNDLDSTVTEFNDSDGALVRTIPVGAGPVDASADGTHVWVADDVGYSGVTELDESDGSFVRNIPVGAAPSGISSDGNHVWVTNGGDNTVSEIDATTGSVVRTIGGFNEPQGIVSNGQTVWVTNFGTFLDPGHSVTEINASTGLVTGSTITGPTPTSVALDGSHVWVQNWGNGTVTELNETDSSVVRSIGSPVSNPYGIETSASISSDGTHVWAANYWNNTVSELDASDGSAIQTIGVGNCPTSTAVDSSGGAWVVNSCDNTISRIAVNFAIVVPSLPAAAPGISYGPVTLQAVNLGTSDAPFATTLKWKKIALPRGLKLSGSGVLSGTPNARLAAGPNSVTVEVTETVVTLNGRKKVKTPTTVQATIPLTIAGSA